MIIKAFLTDVPPDSLTSELHCLYNSEKLVYYRQGAENNLKNEERIP